MWNRHLEPLTITKCFAPALEKLRDLSEAGLIWADCEAFERRHKIGRGTLIVLDAVIPGDYIHRRQFLASTIGEPLRIDHQPPEQTIVLTPSFPTIDSAPIYTRLRQINRLWARDFYEGFVMKRADSVFPVQLRSGTEECCAMVKHRYVV